ncbi:arginine repressor [Liquorilactobacillus mali]|uniref:arginine repressor n=1 Tax=Liquorilactobacillus mali TaxID=1618 RepID=UPI00235058DF|nr:arginine repressor [Liquorilactobacillus mali]MDC7952374.1 arginine repressor [Liquorilactobacillus mali]MDV7756771.1 arginine repressor [Liquorilactobacillus mali]
MKKEVRQAKIEQLITQNEIGTQEELMDVLAQEGIKATQATISRDIREMRIIKEPNGSGRIRYTIFKGNSPSEEEKMYAAISDSVTDVTLVQTMNVVHTLPRTANVLSAVIDDLKKEEVVGTIAGYDTILVISKNKEDAKIMNDLFNKYLRIGRS